MARLTDLVTESTIEEELTEEEMEFNNATDVLEESVINLLLDLAENIDANEFDGAKLLELSEAITTIDFDGELDDDLDESIKRNKKKRKKCRGAKCAIQAKRRRIAYSRRTGAQKAASKKYAKMYHRLTK